MQNGPLAVGTTRGEEPMVVFVTIWTPIPLTEACAAQLRLTHHTQKVFRVPHLTQCCDHLPKIIVMKRSGRNIKKEYII